MFFDQAKTVKSHQPLLAYIEIDDDATAPEPVG
jgi:hypothetical protein